MIAALACLILPLTANMTMISAPAGSPRSFSTGKYRNLFGEAGKSDREIKAKLEAAYKQLFYGNAENEGVYYPVGTDLAYIKDIGNNDIRTEGISYGMMITVQLNHRDEFDRLWRWADQKMRFKTGPHQGFFAWRCDENGGNLADTPASDGEEYFATALYFAAGRWGSGGAINYGKEADSILDAMLHRPAGQTASTPMFDLKEKQVVFVPTGAAATFTDASYHLPAFYELWGRWAPKDRQFWLDAAKTSRKYFRRAIHPQTGLASDYSTFDGKPTKPPWNSTNNSDNFQQDAFRVASNIAVDYAWFGSDAWQVEQSNRLLEFFARQKPDYVSQYTVDGKPLVEYRAVGHVAMNAVAALAATSPVTPRFVNDLWNAGIPTGKWRYYDGLLYLFGLLHVSGQFRVYTPK